MPYIDKKERPKVWEGILKSSGDLNYAIHQTINDYFEQNNRNYNTMNDVIGALECAKMELYRRMIADYEDIKIRENGDCRPYTNWIKDWHKLK